ncbi:MAG: endonuclease NucS [Conexivisphaerales archaeon]
MTDSEHNITRDMIFESPALIDDGAVSLYKEFRIKDCIIDVLLKGADGAILIVEVKQSKPHDAKKQVKLL